MAAQMRADHTVAARGYSVVTCGVRIARRPVQTQFVRITRTVERGRSHARNPTMVPFPWCSEMGWLMLSPHSGDHVFLAWLDTTGDADVALTYPGGDVDDAIATLPWFRDALRPGVPVCAYAVIVDARIRSVYLLHPRADEVARLDAEFRALAADVAGAAAAPFLATVAGTARRSDRDCGRSWPCVAWRQRGRALGR